MCTLNRIGVDDRTVLGKAPVISGMELTTSVHIDITQVEIMRSPCRKSGLVTSDQTEGCPDFQIVPGV